MLECGKLITFLSIPEAVENPLCSILLEFFEMVFEKSAC